MCILDNSFRRYINNDGILISPELKDSLLCLESSFAIIENIRDIVLGRLEAFVSKSQGVRTLGSAALTLCYVAMGIVEGYQCDKLMPWDVAAGVLIIREAGGVVINTNGIIGIIYISKIKSKNVSHSYNFIILLRWGIQRYVAEPDSCC